MYSTVNRILEVLNALVEELRGMMDWSRFDPPGEIKCFIGFKDGCVPVRADAIGDLEKQKAADENLLARWGGITKRADGSARTSRT